MRWSDELLLADRLVGKGDWAGCVEVLQRALSNAPTGPYGRIEWAIRVFENLNAYRSPSTPGNRKLGRSRLAYIKTGDETLLY